MSVYISLLQASSCEDSVGQDMSVLSDMFRLGYVSSGYCRLVLAMTVYNRLVQCISG
jgi:hypothetical protein